MTICKTYDFAVGDILMYQGDSYQVHENLGTHGKVSLFPSVDVVLEDATWNEGISENWESGIASTNSLLNRKLFKIVFTLIRERSGQSRLWNDLSARTPTRRLLNQIT